ncbi:MAG: hypothetical protein OEL83_18850 [Desulforhopalus sp.]|nr:hypothetical protein [Desulforhopalus sp.]
MLDTPIPAQNAEFKFERFDNEILLYSIAGTQANGLPDYGFRGKANSTRQTPSHILKYSRFDGLLDCFRPILFGET